MGITPNAFAELSRIERMQTLAGMFPSLRNKPGVDPWDPDKLLAWAWKSGGNEQAKAAGKLLLTLWDAQRKWPWGKFDFITALRNWDRDHLTALGWYLQDYAHIEPPSKVAAVRKRHR